MKLEPPSSGVPRARPSAPGDQTTPGPDPLGRHRPLSPCSPASRHLAAPGPPACSAAPGPRTPAGERGARCLGDRGGPAPARRRYGGSEGIRVKTWRLLPRPRGRRKWEWLSKTMRDAGLGLQTGS